MKYIKLYEAYRHDPFHAKGYKEELNAEIKKYKEEAERFNKIFADHQLTIDNIEKKWEDENNLAIDNALNTIDICVEPFCEKWDFSEDTDTFHGQDYKCYAPISDIKVTQELITDLVKTNKRVNLELDRDIYVSLWVEGNILNRAITLSSTYISGICKKYNIQEPKESDFGPHTHDEPSININYMSKNLLKIVEAINKEHHKLEFYLVNIII